MSDQALREVDTFRYKGITKGNRRCSVQNIEIRVSRPPGQISSQTFSQLVQKPTSKPYKVFPGGL